MLLSHGAGREDLEILPVGGEQTGPLRGQGLGAGHVGAFPRTRAPPDEMLTISTLLSAASLALPLQGGGLDVPNAPAGDQRPPQPQLSDQVQEKGPAPIREAPSAAGTPAERSRTEAPEAVTGTLPSTLGTISHLADRVFVDRPGGKDVWARGRTYKARMGGGTFDYVPFFGSTAPGNYPVRFSLQEVSVDGYSEPLLKGAVNWSEQAFEQDRGTVIERYLLDTDSVEQTFVVPHRPSGALAVRVSVETELTFQPQTAGAVYRGELGAVRIGAAFAVDADGRRFPLASEHSAEGYTINVPIEVVSAATYPLTIDPIINTFDVDTFPAELTCPKVTTHWTSEVSCVVYVEDFSATDADVFCSLIDAGDNVTLFAYVDMTTDKWSSPDLACAQNDAAVLVASAVGEEVHGRRLGLPAVNFDPVFRVDSGSYGRAKSDVSVGGDPADRCIVVWNREWSTTDGDVFARLVSSSGVPIGTTEIVLDNTSADYRNADCSGHNGTINAVASRWAVVAERRDTATRTVEAAEIAWDGVIQQDFYSIYSSSQQPEFPIVSSPLESAGPKTFMTVFRRDFGSDTDIEAVVFRDGAVVTRKNLSLSDLPGDFLDRQFPAAIETNGLRFSLLWRDVGPERSWVSTLSLLGDGICHGRSALISGAEVAACGSVFPRTLPTGWDPNLLVLWEEESVAPTSIRAAVYNDYAACLGLTFCSSVPNSTTVDGLLYAEGSGVAGEPITLHGLRLPLNQFGMFVVSRDSGSVPGAGGSAGILCLGGQIGRYQSQIVNSGPTGWISLGVDTGAIPTPTQLVAAVPGETWRFQAWHRDTGPAGATSNYTRGLQITFN